MKEMFKPFGRYEIIAENVQTGHKKSYTFPNMLTQPFYDKLFDFFDYTVATPDADFLNLNYLAIGDDDTAAARSQTTLENETFRKTLAFKGSTDSVFTCKAAIDAGEGNPTGGFIKEIAIYADGTATTDSGNMISRTVVNVAKNSNIKLLVTWTFNT